MAHKKLPDDKREVLERPHTDHKRIHPSPSSQAGRLGVDEGGMRKVTLIGQGKLGVEGRQHRRLKLQQVAQPMVAALRVERVALRHDIAKTSRRLDLNARRQILEPARPRQARQRPLLIFIERFVGWLWAIALWAQTLQPAQPVKRG